MTKWYDKGKEHHVKSMEAMSELYGRPKIDHKGLDQLVKSISPWKDYIHAQMETLPRKPLTSSNLVAGDNSIDDNRVES
jgi:hypothetical protein